MAKKNNHNLFPLIALLITMVIMAVMLNQPSNLSDMKMSEAPNSVQPRDGMPPYMQMDDFGKPPILCEVIEAELELETTRKNMVVWAVNAEGVFVGNVPTRYEDGKLKVTLGEKFPSIYYLIQAE